jgi:serine/threonine protein kinase
MHTDLLTQQHSVAATRSQACLHMMVLPHAPQHVPSMQMIQHVAERLATLHAAGYVHRDLKPANVMWLPRANRWTIIDFGCVAKAGVRSPRSSSQIFSMHCSQHNVLIVSERSSSGTTVDL